MKLIDIILEESTAALQAKQRGLHHIGWGRYADGRGRVVAKTVDDTLVDVPKGDLDPEIEQPPFFHDPRQGGGKNPYIAQDTKWSGWQPKKSAPEDVLQKYHGLVMMAGRATGLQMGSDRERKWRKLKPGKIGYDNKNRQYISRSPDGWLASFNGKETASLFASGKSPDDYDFDSVASAWDSIEKIKKDLANQIKNADTARKKAQVIDGAIDTLKVVGTLGIEIMKKTQQKKQRDQMAKLLVGVIKILIKAAAKR